MWLVVPSVFVCVQKQYSRCHSDYAAAKKNGDPKKIEVARGRLASEEQFMRSNEDVLNAGLGKFELERVTELKDFLARYVQNEIFFHARAIESLTAAYADIAKIDPETEKAIFLRRIREMEFQDAGRGVGPAVGVGAGAAAGGVAGSVAPTPLAAGAANMQQPSFSPQGSQMLLTHQQSQMQMQPPTPANQFQPQYAQSP